jgi:hypothetical protein
MHVTSFRGFRKVYLAPEMQRLLSEDLLLHNAALDEASKLTVAKSSILGRVYVMQSSSAFAILLHTKAVKDKKFTLSFIDVASRRVVIVSENVPINSEVQAMIGTFPSNEQVALNWLCEYPPEYLR